MENCEENLIYLTQERAVFIIKILEAKQRELQALLKLYDTSLGLFNLCSEINPKQAKEKSEIESQLSEVQTAINILSRKESRAIKILKRSCDDCRVMEELAELRAELSAKANTVRDWIKSNIDNLDYVELENGEHCYFEEALIAAFIAGKNSNENS